MSLPNTVLDEMLASGCTAEQIARAVKASNIEAEERAAHKRAVDAERKRRQRARENEGASRTVTRTERDSTDAPLVRVEDKPLTQKIEPEGKKESARGVRLAEDWTLPDDWRAEAIGMGLPPERCDPEAATMRDWSRSAQAGAKRDWRAAWRNWVRRALERPRAAGPAPPDKNALANGFKTFAAGLRQQSEIRSGEGGPGIRKALPDLSVVSGGRG